MTHGKPALLHEEVGFTGKRIAERIIAAISDREHTPAVAGIEARPPRAPRGAVLPIAGS